MKTVSKGKLKAKMLEYFHEVETTGEPLLVTDDGREVWEVRPVARKNNTQEALAGLRALAKPTREISESDLMEPLPLDDWEAERKADPDSW